MSETLKRDEIKTEFKWRVEDIYASDSAWNADFEKCMEIAGSECKFKGKLGESVNTLKNALEEYDRADYLVERVYVYAYMKYYEDTANAKYQELAGKASRVVSLISEKYAFLEPELLAIDENVMKEFMASEELSLFVHFLEDLLAQKEHSLSEKEERLLAMAGQMADAPGEIFSKFNNADVKFGTIKDENGRETELTNGRYGSFMENKCRRVREDAFKALYKQYGSYINTLAATFNANVQKAIFYARARGYASTLEMYLDNSFIPVRVYENLIETVNENLGKMHRYVEIRKKALGVEELHFYDVYAPMVSDIDVKYSYGEAKEIVLKALEPLGKEYVDTVRKGYETGWVDVLENQGKRSGAFSWGTYGVHPYIFLNYNDTLNDVFTLIHETGHAMHSYYSNNTQPHIYAGYKIFVAEVASTCNEAILIRYMLDNCEDKAMRKYLINHYLEQFKGTLFRQTMFAEFEMKAHSLAEAGEVLNAKLLCDMYRKLNEKYFGEHMVIDDEIALEWARIPHFYTPFYVYQYATGFSAAIAIASKILNKEEGIIEKYKKFLSGGSSMHPIDLLKLCDVDMENPAVVSDALKVFEDLLDEWNG